MSYYNGLSSKEAEDAIIAHGLNILESPPHKSALVLLFEKLTEPLTIILGAAALVSVLTGEWIEGCGILSAIILSAGIGFISEYRAGRAFDILNKTNDEIPVKTMRDGKVTEIPKSHIVEGDIVFTERGDEIPADGIVLECNDFQLDQSKFTGEPEGVRKVPHDDPEYTELSSHGTYRADLALRGSSVVSGNAVLRICAVGMKTEIGKTARSASEITDETTPLQKQLARLSKVIAIFGVSLATLLFIILATKHAMAGDITLQALITIFMIAVTLIVVTVPEGLPMSVTLSLACSMRKMARANCLVRRLHATETIGCTTVICTDKTGTLTKNCMTVAESFFPQGSDELVSEAVSINSNADLDAETDKVIGNPTEGALLLFLRTRNVDYAKERSRVSVVRQWSFNSESKFMATRLALGRLHLKGAPEIVLAKCGSIYRDGVAKVLDDETRKNILNTLKNEQDRARRTLGFAFSDDKNADPQSTNSLVWLGALSIADPVRDEVPDAVASCRKAGIKIKIVTGDTPATAQEIARIIGLTEGRVIEGRDFEALDEKSTVEAAESLSVIARARPHDKLKLVNTLKSMNEVVAVTGDGTNDAPAMHHADVGISMGKTGTAIAREASDIILLDDSFGSIVNAVLWGRSLYLNIQRFLVFQLTINVAAAGIAVSGPFMGIEMPFTVIQMLWINLIMDSFAALALATEPPSPHVMDEPPRKPGSFIITKKMAFAIFGTALFFIVLFFAGTLIFAGKGFDDRMLTIFFNVFVMLQLWNLLNVREWGRGGTIFSNPPNNPFFGVILILILIIQIVITQFGGKVFRTVPLEFGEWAAIIGGTSVLFFGCEIWRVIRGIFQNRKSRLPS